MIILNVVVTALGGPSVDEDTSSILLDIELAVAIVFAVEVGLKISVLGVKRYFRSK